ncbi:MAG: hypothetical protein ACJAVK_000088 [Akkermansiaceae bacterium]
MEPIKREPLKPKHLGLKTSNISPLEFQGGFRPERRPKIPSRVRKAKLSFVVSSARRERRDGTLCDPVPFFGVKGIEAVSRKEAGLLRGSLRQIKKRVAWTTRISQDPLKLHEAKALDTSTCPKDSCRSVVKHLQLWSIRTAFPTSSGNFTKRSCSIRRPSVLVTLASKPSTSIVSPGSGRWPSCCTM